MRERSILRTGAAAIAMAVLLRVLGGVPGTAEALTGPDMAAALVYLGTGRLVSLTLPAPELQTPEAQSPTELTQPPEPTELPKPTVPETEPETEPETQPAEDARELEVGNFSGYPLDVEKLLQTELPWDLKGPGPSVLIFHTHTTESYANTDEYVPCGAFHTLDEDCSVVSVGEELARLLKERGIGVIHDRTLHDYPSYNNAYPLARNTIAGYLQEYPGLQLILDIHRDAAEDRAGNQVSFTTELNGQEMAKLMVVVGTDASGLHHPNWEKNLAAGVRVHARLEGMYPGLCRPLAFRAQRYNQDMAPGMLLIEVGAAGNTQEQALAAMKPLADALESLANGA